MFFKFAFYLVFEPQTIWCLISTKKKSPTWCKNTFPFTKSHLFVLFYINPTWDCLFMCSCEPGYPWNLFISVCLLPLNNPWQLMNKSSEIRNTANQNDVRNSPNTCDLEAGRMWLIVIFIGQALGFCWVSMLISPSYTENCILFYFWRPQRRC